VRVVVVASDGSERIDGGERQWSRIDGGDNSGYNCSGGDNSGEIQEIWDSNSLLLNPLMEYAGQHFRPKHVNPKNDSQCHAGMLFTCHLSWPHQWHIRL